MTKYKKWRARVKKKYCLDEREDEFSREFKKALKMLDVAMVHLKENYTNDAIGNSIMADHSRILDQINKIAGEK